MGYFDKCYVVLLLTWLESSSLNDQILMTTSSNSSGYGSFQTGILEINPSLKTLWRSVECVLPECVLPECVLPSFLPDLLIRSPNKIS